ncbi:MAG: UvrD-helicase domain-containing protein, partial [Syntrophomonadaceae bacterium]|nr:UvrD-helicase domain-containing protein [Syntrophomonadaceae bacterium]
MSSGAPLKDQAARLAIVTDLDTCMLVEAGAGSGKTRSLVERMVALVGEGRCQAGEMAALTFTRKAAAEMKARFRMELERQAAGEVDSARRQRLREGVERLHDCFVGTIHSFCAALLRERPVEAGLDPGFLEMEDLEDQLLRREAWNDYLRQVQRERPQALHSLEEKGVRARDLWGVYQALSTYPEVTPACRPVPRPDLAAVRRRTEDFIRGVARFLPRGVPEERYDELQKRIARLQRRLHFLGPGDASLVELLRLCERKPPRVAFKRWDTRQDAECALEELTRFREEVACPFLRQWREYLYPEVIDFVQPAVQHCAGMRQASSRLNFQDLLLRARDLLRDHPHVRRYFQRRWRRVLVDEFQDTDPLQAEILFYLTGTDVEQRDWRLLAPRAGSLFVVGDPKQSIYRFRRADIDTYNEVRELIEQAGGRTLYLTTNFRSVHPVGQWAN